MSAFAIFNKTLSNVVFTYNVGIGTSVPSQLLHVNGNETHIGNVGIGTLSPIQPLHVNGTSTFIGNIGIGSTQPGAALDILASDVNGININQTNGARNALSVTTSISANTMVINGQGQVGIYTSSPIQNFHVETSSIFRSRLGIGATMVSPTVDLHLLGDTLGLPAVYSYGTLTGNTFVFTLRTGSPGYKVHKIRFSYSSPALAGGATHSATLTGITGTNYSTNISSMANGGTWTSLSATSSASAPTISYGTITANNTISGEFTIYNNDLSGTGFANIAIDILSPTPARIFGNMRVTIPSGNLTEFRYTFPTPTDCVGYYSVTGYPS